jgi:hypothetical protein
MASIEKTLLRNNAIPKTNIIIIYVSKIGRGSYGSNFVARIRKPNE